MKVLLISLYFAPDTASTGVFMRQLCEGLRRFGNQVTVVTSFPHYKSPSISKEYQGKLMQREYRNSDLTVFRTWVCASPSNATFSQRAFNYLSFNILSTAISTCIGGQDVILSTSPPLTVGFTAYLISRARRTPYIYAIQDIWPEIVVEVGWLRSRYAIAFFKWMERLIYRKAFHLTVISEAMRSNLLNKEVPDEKITVIPSIVDTDFIRPLAKSNSFNHKMELGGRFVVLHAGNLGHSQGVETLLECAHQLRAEPDILFLIVGDGAAMPGLVARSQEMGLDNTRFLPFQPWEEVPYLLAASDVQVALLKRGLAASSTPSKVYSAMASGRPIVVAMDKGSDTWNLVQQTRSGLCVEPEDSEQLAEAILTLYRDAALRQEMGQNGRRYAEQHLSQQVVARQYHELLQRVVAQAKREDGGRKEEDGRR